MATAPYNGPMATEPLGLRDIATFVAVVEHGGFRAASEALFISQPSISRRIKRLEAELGVTLLERGAWGLRLNGHGEALFRSARPLLAMLDEAREAAVGGREQTIRLGAAASAAGGFLAGFLTTWIPNYPASRLVMIEGATVALRERLLRFECDAAVLAAPIPPNLAHRPLTRVRVQALLPEQHPLAADDGPLPVTDLDGVGILLPGEGFLVTELTNAACRLAGVTPDVLYECTVGQTLAALATAGLGVAILGDKTDVRGYDLPRRDLRDPAGNALEYELHIAWMRERPLRPIVHTFIEELYEATSDLRT